MLHCYPTNYTCLKISSSSGEKRWRAASIQFTKDQAGCLVCARGPEISVKREPDLIPWRRCRRLDAPVWQLDIRRLREPALTVDVAFAAQDRGAGRDKTHASGQIESSMQAHQEWRRNQVREEMLAEQVGLVSHW